MRKLEEILEYNKSFVENKEYEQYVTWRCETNKKCRSYYNASFWKYYEKCFSCNLRI